ncbi:hypothetical protein MAPG_08823 [Magnaporthiopsis poae ATCC 64411]|uniref:Rhodopsin domain-containing protein n=1 Tax=Magnaporthiopsis poae (strain ATCC 64411 / 73-15) TaxID=644358 RepID=A0A0C4E8C3_MAGP6|nr:hypothetical protein MAPG_08823 [Magnaporthiopsis poae ATCC 64411]
MSKQTGPGDTVPPPSPLSGAGAPRPGTAGPPGFGLGPSKMPHNNRQPELLAVIWVLTASAALFLGLRLYCRLLKSRRIFSEDWVLVASFVCLLTQSVLVTVQVGMGFGRHFWDIPMQNAEPLILLGFVVITLVIVSQVWSKTSFAMTLLRLTTISRTRYFLWFVIVSINAIMGLNALLIWIRCSPLDKAWKPFASGGTCWDGQFGITFGIVASVYSGITDVVLAFLPWKLILPLQLKMAEKIGVILALSMGILAGVAAAFKASYISTLGLPDFEYDGVPLITWGAAEPAITIIAASVPVLRVFVRDITAASQGYFQRSGSGGVAALECGKVSIRPSFKPDETRNYEERTMPTPN